MLILNVRGSSYLGQFHGCWCPGSLRRQDIISHDINCIGYVDPSLTWGRIFSTCVKSMWRNDIKSKYMFMFPQNKLACKWLSTATLSVSILWMCSCHHGLWFLMPPVASLGVCRWVINLKRPLGWCHTECYGKINKTPWLHTLMWLICAVVTLNIL